jgi:2-polyprenyl-3-methyl-5-hydroxy-6-metoxy-1,4-benzoquinol methylase
MTTSTLFDLPIYEEINEARWAVAERTLDALAAAGPALRTCLDVGSGVGWFAQRLRGRGLTVRGLEGREGNLQEARRRVPGVEFLLADVESDRLADTVGPADLVLCFGLLYHVENPFRVVRNLRALTGAVLILETQIVPRPEALAWLVAENTNETQGLTAHALVPSASALEKMLQVAGFEHVYRNLDQPRHEDFEETDTRHRRRGLYVASRRPLALSHLQAVGPVVAPKYDYTRGGGGA